MRDKGGVAVPEVVEKRERPASGDADLGVHKHPVQAAAGQHLHQLVAAAGTERGAAHERKRHVGAELRGEVVERLGGQRVAVLCHQRVRGDERCGRIRGTASHPSRDEDVLVHLDVHAGHGHTGARDHRLNGPPREVARPVDVLVRLVHEKRGAHGGHYRPVYGIAVDAQPHHLTPVHGVEDAD